MNDGPIRSALILPDDVFRARLAATISEMENWVAAHRDCADCDMSSTSSYWKLRVVPRMTGACPFEMMFRANQTFSMSLAREVYEDRPFDTFEFFPMLARAVAGGHVERIETRSALTGALEAIEMRVVLEDGWAWIGERRVGARQSRRVETAEERRVYRFLPYRR